jgi:CRP/FNR family transcriptional regulator, cyclic AMP receptor protein
MEVDELIVSVHPFLKGMREQHLRSLSELAMRTNFAEGEWIFREGERADRFYLIEEGSVILTSCLPTHSHLVIQTLGAGDAVGWSCLFEPYTWHLNARRTRRHARYAFTQPAFASNANKTRNWATNSWNVSAVC